MYTETRRFSHSICIDVYEVRPQLDLPATNCSILTKLLNTGVQSDVDIVCPTRNKKDTKTFNCHKCILAAHSKVFEKMFMHSMSESLNNTVEIKDIDADTFQNFLQFLYSFKLPSGLTDSALQNVMIAADKYGVEPLVVSALGKLIGEVTVETVAEAYLKVKKFKQLQQAQNIVEKLLHFIGRNLKGVLNSKKWLEVEKKSRNLSRCTSVFAIQGADSQCD
eukprot:UN32152